MCENEGWLFMHHDEDRLADGFLHPSRGRF
jgi:hypothetical protein